MKCYEYTSGGSGSKLTAGFPIQRDDNNAHVRILEDVEIAVALGTMPKAYLGQELCQSLLNLVDSPFVLAGKIRLSNCDIEQRSEIWLMPESSETKHDALVLCTGHVHCNTVTATVSGAGSEILATVPASYVGDAPSSWHVLTVLAHLKPGGRLIMDYTGSWFHPQGTLRRTLLVLEAQPDGTVKAIDRD